MSNPTGINQYTKGGGKSKAPKTREQKLAERKAAVKRWTGGFGKVRRNG